MSSDNGGDSTLPEPSHRLVPAEDGWHKSADMTATPGMLVYMFCGRTLQMAFRSLASAWPTCAGCQQARRPSGT